MRTIALWLSLLLVFVIPWENIVHVGGLGTVSRAAGLLVAVFWISVVIVTGEFRKPRAFHIVVLTYFLWHLMSVLWSIDTGSSLPRAMTYLQLSGLVLILWDMYRTPAALRAGLQAYVLGAYVGLASMMADYDPAASYERVTATGFNANDIALILALGIPVAWYLAVESQVRARLFLRLVNYAYIPAAYMGILLTSSRAGFFSTVPALLYMLGSLTQLKLHIRILLFIGLIGASFALQSFIPEQSLSRLAGTGTVITEGDLNHRTVIWGEAIDIVSEHPILGVGTGAFRAATGGAPHSFVVGLLAEVGIIGCGWFLIILGMTVYYVRLLPKRHCRLWLVILMVWFIGAATHNWEHRKQTWLFLSLAVSSTGLYVRRDEHVPKTIDSRLIRLDHP